MDDILWFFFFQAEDGIRDKLVTGVQTCALPIFRRRAAWWRAGGGRSGPARAWRRGCRRAAVPRTAGSRRLQKSPEHLIPLRHERPGHAAGEVGDRAAVHVELRGGGSGRAEAQQRGGAPLPGGPAPVQRRVVAREGLERGGGGRREAAEREHEPLPLGAGHRGARRVEARAVDFGGGGGERRADRPAAARYH